MVKRVSGPWQTPDGPVKRQTYNTETATKLASAVEPIDGSRATLYEARNGQLFIHTEAKYREPEKAGQIQHTILPTGKKHLTNFCEERGLDWHKQVRAPANTSTTLYVRMPKSLKAKIDAEAKRLRKAGFPNLSVNALVSARLETAFDDEQPLAAARAIATAWRALSNGDNATASAALCEAASLASGLTEDELDDLARGGTVELPRGISLRLPPENIRDLH